MIYYDRLLMHASLTKYLLGRIHLNSAFVPGLEDTPTAGGKRGYAA